MVKIVSPDHMNFMSWANSVVTSCKGSSIPSPVSEEKWKDWASSLSPLNNIGAIPSTDNFDKWKDWGYAFMRSVK